MEKFPEVTEGNEVMEQVLESSLSETGLMLLFRGERVPRKESRVLLERLPCSENPPLGILPPEVVVVLLFRRIDLVGLIRGSFFTMEDLFERRMEVFFMLAFPCSDE